MAATSPALDTVATDVLSELQVTGRPVNTPPFPSNVVAVPCAVSTALIEFGTRTTVTDATGMGVTVMVALPLTPSAIAVIVAEPGATAVTSPLASTVATDSSLDSHAIARVSGLPDASLAVAVSCCVEPATMLVAAGVTLTVATGIGLIVIVALPLFPSLVAVMLALPALTAVTTPAEETVATPGSPEDQLIIRPLRVLPLASRVTADADVLWPTVIGDDANDTLTDATGTGVTVSVALPLVPSLVAVI
jgi:hypothetical protein